MKQSQYFLSHFVSYNFVAQLSLFVGSLTALEVTPKKPFYLSQFKLFFSVVNAMKNYKLYHYLLLHLAQLDC